MEDSLEQVDLGDLELGALDTVRPEVELERVRIAGGEAQTASWIGKALVVILGVAILGHIACAFLAPNSPAVEALERASGTIAPLVGVALGYYFSGRRIKP